MTALGWLMLGVSWTGILSLTAYCVWRSVAGKSTDLTAPLNLEVEIDRDADNKDVR